MAYSGCGTMTKQYYRDSKAVFYVTFLSEDGSDTPVVTNPTIKIQHIDKDGLLVVDISSASLVQVGTSNQYYYQWDVPQTADIATYHAIYNANIDSNDVEDDEEFQIQNDPGDAGGIS